MNPTAIFPVESFESFANRRDREQGVRELVRLLQSFDRHYGDLEGIVSMRRVVDVERPDAHLPTRLASALTCLLSDPGFRLSELGFAQLIGLQRWIGTLFAATPFGNADHVLATMDLGGTDGALQVRPSDLARFCLLYTPDSELQLDVDALWAHHPRHTAALLLALLSPRFLGTRAAHGKRETLLGWLPRKLAELEFLETLPRAILHDVYMHCSYAEARTLRSSKPGAATARIWPTRMSSRRAMTTRMRPLSSVCAGTLTASASGCALSSNDWADSRAAVTSASVRRGPRKASKTACT